MNTATAASPFPTRLLNARRAVTSAEVSIRPIDDETAERMIARMGRERFEAMEAEVAALAASLPTLRAELAVLEAHACSRCAGTGEYSAPTRIYRGSRPLCFGCGGTGVRKK
jgi:hypothetical protein